MAAQNHSVTWFNIDLANTNPGSRGYGWVSRTRQEARARQAKHAQGDMAQLSRPIKLASRVADGTPDVDARWAHQDDFGTEQVWIVRESGDYVLWFVTRSQADEFLSNGAPHLGT